MSVAIIFPRLFLANARNNNVTTDALSGSIANTVDQTSAATNFVKTNAASFVGSSPSVLLNTAVVNFAGSTVLNFPQITGALTNNISQTSAKTAVLGATTFASGSTFNASGATISSVALTGAASDSIDNATLPSTVTRSFNSTSVVGTTVSVTNEVFGSSGTGSQMTRTSKSYLGPNSNVAGTIATLTGIENASSSKWSMFIQASGESTSSNAVGAWRVYKVGTANTWIVEPLAFNTTNSSNLALPTLTATASSATLTFAQVAANTNDGTVSWTLASSFVAHNINTSSVPVFS